jgi:hypothetical protein
MKQSQKLDALIKRILKEELDEAGKVFAGEKAIPTLVSDEDYKRLDTQAKKNTINALKKGGSATLENEEEKEPEMDQQSTGTDIAGQVAEIVEKLKQMSEGGKDPKKQRLAEKVMKYMESAKAALEALTGHESMLEEKDQATKEKVAQGHLKAIEKHLGKIVRDKDAVGKMMKKMPIEKVIAMKQKMQSKEKELDEERVAKAMLKYSLQEGLVKKKYNLKEAQNFVEYMHILNDLLDPDRIAHLAKHTDQITKTIMVLGAANVAAKFIAKKTIDLLTKAKKPGAVKPQEVEKLKDEIKIAYDKAPEEKKKEFDNQMQTIEKEVEKEVKIAESLKKK